MIIPKPAFRPLNTIVLITLEAPAETVKGSEAGLSIPQVAQEKPQEGTVVRIGPEVEQLSIGDRVSFNKFSGQPIEIDGQKYQYLKEAEIVGVFE